MIAWAVIVAVWLFIVAIWLVAYVRALLVDLAAERARVARLEGAIREHRDQKADDRCWMDDLELYRVLPCDGRKPDNHVGDTGAMLRNCERFIARRCAGGVWRTYAELEAENDELKAENGRLFARTLSVDVTTLDSKAIEFLCQACGQVRSVERRLIPVCARCGETVVDMLAHFDCPMPGERPPNPERKRCPGCDHEPHGGKLGRCPGCGCSIDSSSMRAAACLFADDGHRFSDTTLIGDERETRTCVSCGRVDEREVFSRLRDRRPLTVSEWRKVRGSFDGERVPFERGVKGRS